MQEQFIIRGIYLPCSCVHASGFPVVFVRLVVDFVPTLGL